MKLNTLLTGPLGATGPTGPCGHTGPHALPLTYVKAYPLHESIDHEERNQIREQTVKTLKGIDLGTEEAKQLLASFMVDEANSEVQIKQLLFKLKHNDKPPLPPKTEEDVRGWLHVMADGMAHAKDIEKTEINSKLEVIDGHGSWKIPETVNQIPVKFLAAAHIDADKPALKSLEGCPKELFSLRISGRVKSLKGISKKITILILQFWWSDKSRWTFMDLSKEKVNITEKLVIGHLSYEEFIRMKPLALLTMPCPTEIEFDSVGYNDEGKKMTKMNKIWQIIKKHWKSGGDIIDAQHELIEAGLEEATKL